MTLFEYLELVPDGIEITVFDKDYDIEIYFYGGVMNSTDIWEKLMGELSKKLTIVEIGTNGISVNFSNLIENNLKNIENENLFIKNYIDNIMADIPSILAGNVSEQWMQRFINCLEIC